MKKIILIMLLLIALTSMLLAEDMQLQEISLDKLLSDYLPNYKIEKQIQLEGIGRDFAVAKDTGEIVAVTKTDKQYIVKMLDSVGNCLWTHSFDSIYYNINAFVSDNGHTITLFLNEGYGRGKNIIISNEGQILYESPISKSYYYPSPDGNYVYENINMMGTTRQKEIRVYNVYGEKITIIGLENYQIRNIRIKFATTSHLIAFIEQENSDSILMLFCEFNKGNITVLWDYEFEEGYSGNFDTHNMATEMISIFQDKIAVNACESGFYVFDFDGNIQYNDNKPVLSFAFSQYGNLIIERKEDINVLNSDFDIEKVIDFSLINEMSGDNILSFIKFDNFYLIDIKRFFFQQRKYHTFINENYKINIIQEDFFYLSINNTDVIIVFSYKPISSISILFGGEE